MKIVQSFWSKPFLSKKSNFFDRAKGGWISEKMFYLSIALSCLSIKKFYSDITLITDEWGKYMLIDILNLPYANVIVELNKLDKYDKDFWALGKIYSYSIQNEPFLHIDNDIFIWETFNNSILDKDVIFQNYETNINYYGQICKKIKKDRLVFPSIMNNYIMNNGCIDKFSAINAGILGGNNIQFFKEYTQIAFDLINNNLDRFKVLQKARFNVIFEQSLFYCLLINENLTKGYLFETIDSEFIDVNKICMVPKENFIHAIAGWKKNIELNETIYFMMATYYPDYFEKINRRFK